MKPSPPPLRGLVVGCRSRETGESARRRSLAMSRTHVRILGFDEEAPKRQRGSGTQLHLSVLSPTGALAGMACDLNTPLADKPRSTLACSWAAPQARAPSARLFSA